MFPLMVDLVTIEVNNLNLSNVIYRLQSSGNLFLSLGLGLGLDLAFTFGFACLGIYQKHISRPFYLLFNSLKQS